MGREENPILFTYMVPHTGHSQAAEALMRATRLINPHQNVLKIELGSHTFPLLTKWINALYYLILKRTPRLWNYIYDNPSLEKKTQKIRSILTRASSAKIKNLLKSVHPAAIVCTQAVAATAMAAQKRNGKFQAPLIGVITDFSVHSYWRLPEIDLYLVAHSGVAETLISKGIDPKKIQVTGIPIDPRFSQKFNQLNLTSVHKEAPQKKSVLIIGGSQGLGNLEGILHSIQRLAHEYNVVVVCGTNSRLKSKLTRIFMEDPSVTILGFADNMADLYAKADLVISKPGGISCSEILARSKPLFLVNPIPGQEQRNSAFLDDQEAAILVRDNKDLYRQVQAIMKEPTALKKLQKKAQKLSKPHSALDGAKHILAFANRESR